MRAPSEAGGSFRPWRRRVAAAATIAALLSACAGSKDNQVLDPVVLAMNDQVAPTFDDGQTQIFQVSTPVVLPVRQPIASELSELGAQDPYPRAPFQLSGDTRITVKYIVSNLDNAPHTIEVLVDPWNEFVHFVPGIVVSDEGAEPNLSGIDKYFVLPALARVEGVFTPDDMKELATDLATCQAIANAPPAEDSEIQAGALMNRAFNTQNRSFTGDPVLNKYFPKVVAGLTGFDLGIRSPAPANVSVELVIDITDVYGNRVIPYGEPGTPIGDPGTVLTPPAPAAN